MTATKEVINLSTVLPFVQRWQAAIARRDVGASVQAGQDYQAAWQAVEVYLNHRSLPLYTDIEPDTQFVIDDGLKQPQPDWPALSKLVQHLHQQCNRAISFVSAQPPLSPLFDDLVPLRGARAQLLISRDALTAGDVAKAVREVLPAIPSGCEQGICGACRTVVLAGEPDHRDELLSSAERAAGAMLISVSRARSERLTLDL